MNTRRGLGRQRLFWVRTARDGWGLGFSAAKPGRPPCAYCLLLSGLFAVLLRALVVPKDKKARTGTHPPSYSLPGPDRLNLDGRKGAFSRCHLQPWSSWQRNRARCREGLVVKGLRQSGNSLSVRSVTVYVVQEIEWERMRAN